MSVGVLHRYLLVLYTYTVKVPVLSEIQIVRYRYYPQRGIYIPIRCNHEREGVMVKISDDVTTTGTKDIP
jgi:hypothetical protein